MSAGAGVPDRVEVPPSSRDQGHPYRCQPIVTSERHAALRMKVILAKARRNRAEIANLEAVIADEPPPFSRDDLGTLRVAIEIAALHARTAGVAIDDIVGPDLGRF